MSDNSSQSFLDNLQNILFKLDVTVGHSDQLQVLLKYKDDLEKMGNDLKGKKDKEYLGVLLRTLGDFSSNVLGMAGGISPKNTLCAGLDKKENQIQKACFDLNYHRAEKVYQYVKNEKKITPYLNRHRLLEWAIGLLIPFMAGEKIIPGTERFQKGCKLIARSYLLRAHFVLVKGQSIPAKKMEAIQKAWEWAFVKDDVPDDVLLLEIALARKKYLPDADHTWLKGYLKRLVESLPPSNELPPLQFAGLDIGREDGYLDEEIDKVILTFHCKADPAYLPLIRARAAFRCKAEDLKDKLAIAAEKLKNRWLSDPLWDDTVTLIQQVADQNPGGDTWKDPAIKAFGHCENMTRGLSITLHVRWYWSRQASLYDLAFHAYSRTDPNILKVVDALKSRPVLKMDQAEKYLKDKDQVKLKDIWEIETNALSEAYQTELSDLKPRGTPMDDVPTWQPVPDGYTAVHFYLSDRTGTGHMILVPPREKPQQAQQVFSFALPRVLDVFERWQNALEQCGNDVDETNERLKSICKVLGEIMEKGLSAVNTPGIIFIPHGFLHLAPLHAALVNGRPLFEQKTCLFLPAWWIYAPDQRVPDESGSKVLLAHWNRPEIDETVTDSRWTKVKKECTPEDYVKLFENNLPLDFLAFYCHGRRHYSNPYLSALELKDRDLTHQDLIHHTPPYAFKGSRVLISACESDMGAGVRGLVDEHLSISSAFLNKGARQVCGSLYRGMSDVGKALIEKCLGSESTGLCGKVHAVQKDFINGDNELRYLYKSAAYRVVGLPDDA
jgi:CHAT domain-containing protein